VADKRDASLLGLAAGASLSPNMDNEDAVATARNVSLAVGAIVVADGVGSADRAGEASRFLVTRFADIVTCADAPVDLPAVYLQLRDALDEYARTSASPPNPSQSVLASTLISVVEYDLYFDIAYLGNGAIWHVRGNFDQFRDTQYLPWNALNYLNPHTNPDTLGRESLYKSFAAGAADLDVSPTCVRLSKDERYGDIIMICTDGIYSFDQVRIHRLALDNSIWIPGEPLMIRFFSALTTFFAAAVMTSRALSDVLCQYLAEARDARLLDDDATVAVLITRAALQFHSRRAAERRA
jgi:hypothetical protein